MFILSYIHKRLLRCCMLPVLLIISISASSQNLNTPNKRGPLGTQVNTLTGNLFIPRYDVKIPARGFDIDIIFYYNSYLFFQNEGFGNGWDFEYNVRYKNDSTAGGKIIEWGDGRADTYDSLPGGTYSAPRGFYSKFTQYQPGKFRLITTDSIVYFFDDSSHKKITKMQEPNGNYLQFSYSNKRLVAVTSSVGQSISFTYDGTGRLSSMIDAIANPTRTFTYKYDAAGNLTEVKDPLNGTQKYTYLVNGPMKTIGDKNANIVDIIYNPDFSTRELIGCNKRLSFSYDTSQNKTIVTDHFESGTNQVTTYNYARLDNLLWITSMQGNCCGFNVKYEYDDQGNVIKETDANGHVYSYTYDDRGNMLSITDPQQGTSTYTYSAGLNQITSFKDAAGKTYTLEYDTRGNLTKITAPDGSSHLATYNSNGDIISSTDSRGNNYVYNYDAFGNPSSVTGPNGYTAQLLFDARGNLLSYTDARGNAHTAEYDILGRLKKITDPINNTRQYGYDTEGNLVSVINKNNETVQLNYDASNRPVKITGPTGNTAELGFDEMDNLVRIKNAEGQQTEFGYDTRNRLTSWKDALGTEASYQYDANGNLISARYPNGRTINFVRDKLNRITKVYDGTGDIATYSYDAVGNMISYKDGTGAETTRMYDAKDRLVKMTDPLGNSISYSYDNEDNVISITDKNGFTTHYTYDSSNRVKTVTDNNGFTSTVGYDALGNIAQLTDQKGNTTNYTYDELNRRKRMTFADGSYQEYTYDNKGNMLTKRLTDGTNVQFAYDSLNRMVSKTMPGGEIFAFTYDALGKVKTASNSKGTIHIDYDAVGRVIAEEFNGTKVSYRYEPGGRTQTIIYPDSSEVIKEYDTRNRLSRILKDSVVMAEYAYNNNDRMSTKRTGNGVETNFQYDLNNRLISISTAGGQIQKLNFTYDKVGNKKTVTYLNNPSQNEIFSYDNGYRLTNYQRGAQQSSFTYDAVGNRTAAVINGANATFTVNNLNQLTSKNGVNFSYDGRGNLTYDGQFYKTYDAEGRLIKDSSAPGSVLTYEFDAIGRRISKTINGSTYKYSYSGLAQIQERNAANTIISQTIFNNFLSPVTIEHTGNRFFYHHNDQLSVDAISSNAGRLVESYRYEAYGKLQRFDSLNNPLATSLAGNRFGFTGQEWDNASNSYRFFFRNYSPETGVFNQRDLIEYGDGMGMYQYVGNNPANGIDVLGLEDCNNKYDRTEIGYSVNAMAYINEATIDKRIAIKNNYTNEWIRESKRYSDRYWEKGIIANNEVDRQRFFKIGRQNDANLAAYQKTAAANAEAIETKAAKAGKILQAADNAIKAEAFASSIADGQSNEQYTQEVQAGGELALSALGWTPIGAGFGTLDFIVETTTGTNITTHAAQMGEAWGKHLHDDSYKRDLEAYEYAKSMGKGKQWLETRKRINERERKKKDNCPKGGTQLRPRYVWDPVTGQLRIVWPIDPNEIVGPDGVSEKKFVSVKDRMNYTIRCENDTIASAPARFIRITTTPHEKHDAASFELGSFGFNNQSFEIPSGLSNYTQRLDCRDSMGLYVDVVAGYDQVANIFFWEFRGIDPLTLLPTDNPEKGILFLQDSTQPLYGHGFVTFSIKPRQNAVTLDTTAAKASIVFDDNAAIETNVWTNTIDAFAPSSSMLTSLPASTSTVTLPIQYSATDDAHGVGYKSADLYVSVNSAPPILWVSGYTGTDTMFIGLKGNTYTFLASASDKVNNKEELKSIGTVSIRPGDCIGSDFVFEAGTTGASYQWQVDEGAGFVNLSNNSTYEGVNTATLLIKSATGPMAGFRYRALVNLQFTQPDTLKFVNYWTGNISDAWEDPLNWSCLTVPNEFSNVVIEGNKDRYPLVNSNPIIRGLQANTGSSITVRNGYTITVLK